MSGYKTYYISRQGDLYLCDRKGECRKADEKEWLAVWRDNPEITLQLAAQN